MFHHLGIATNSLEQEAQAYATLGYELEGEEFTDVIQGVRGLFLRGGGPRLELLEPLPGNDTLTPILRRGIKCYHHAYEVPSLDEALAKLRGMRAQVVRPPAQAIAFDYRLVVFLMLPNMWMVELIEGEA
jgi:Glyoxalase/Bleomycin resistance protein/Dioxygenase superfamily